MYQQDRIIIDSHKQFRIRNSGYLRSIGLSQIIATKEYIEIQFIGGEYWVRILYPSNLAELGKAIEQEFLAETQMSEIEIDNVKFHILDQIDEIEEARTILNH